MIIYHGTNSKNIDSILKYGLIPNKTRIESNSNNNNLGFTYFSTAYAPFYAMTTLGSYYGRKNSDEGKAIILECDIDLGKYHNSIYPDEQFLFNHFKVPYDSTISVEDNKDLWRTSLDSFGSFAFKGTLSPNCILRWAEVPTILDDSVDFYEPRLTFQEYKKHKGTFSTTIDFIFDSASLDDVRCVFSSNSIE